jgi:hypothetical protein
MPKFTITLTLAVEADTVDDAKAIGHTYCEHLADTCDDFNIIDHDLGLWVKVTSGLPSTD